MASRLDDTYQGTGDDYKYPSYFDAVIEEATKTYGLSEDEIVQKWLQNLHRDGCQLTS